MGIVMIPAFIVLGLGDIYWLWMAIQLGSFWMFVVGLLGPAAFLTGAAGAWSFFMGPPDWIYSWFG